MCTFALSWGQITGEVTDESGEPIPYASVIYKGHHIASASNADGQFSIARHEGWTLTVSSVGFKPQTFVVNSALPNVLKVKLKEDATALGEVVIKSKRGRYSRKNNPAVELMRRVIAAKKKTNLEETHDYYQYNKYQKITLALNNINLGDVDSLKGSKKWYLNQIETSPYNNKLILPVSVDETVTRRIFRKDPRDEKDIILGQQSQGVNQLFSTGDMVNTMLKEVFQDVDIYDDRVRLLQYPFTSPIGETAIAFYRFYIEDTVYVDRDLCYHLNFIPNNQQDFGFRGDLYVLADSSLHVKRCELTIPHKSDVNFVRQMHLTQEFTKLETGEWVLSVDDMWAEIALTGFMKDVLVVRNTRLSDYDFEPLQAKLFRGKAKVRHEAGAMQRNEDFWNQYRTVELTSGESGMQSFINRLQQTKGFGWLITGLKVFIENYLETGTTTKPSKFDFGPMNTIISHNFVDGYRLRLSGRTMAALNPHWFWDGYIARGLSSHKWYYGSEITYALNAKEHSPFEFPQRNIIFETAYDVMSPADKFLEHNKDNVFMAFRAKSVNQMYFYNRQRLAFDYETDWGFRFNTSLQRESNEVAGDLQFLSMADGIDQRKFRTTELMVNFRFCPGQTYINTKQKRYPVNLDSPDFSISHTMGLKHFLGGQYKMNLTEASIYKRQWFGSWGYLDTYLKAGAQWNKVPFPLLIMPPANLTYFETKATFNLMDNMEFLSDRYAFWSMSWDMNGKLFNRIPLLKHLKWREYIAFKGMWGKLTDKNNPLLERNANDPLLWRMPNGSYALDPHKPYMEIVAGVHNIFKFFAIDWVHRINYNEHPGTHKNGIRFWFMLSF